MTNRKPGRPFRDEDNKTIPFTVRITAKEYDNLYTKAARDKCSLSEVMRRSTFQNDKAKRVT